MAFVHSGRLFRSLARGALGLRLDASQVPRIFKAMARDAGLAEQVVETISGHSTRVGAAQDMVASGIGIAAIRQAGRWKTPSMVHRYGERLLARRSGAAQLSRVNPVSPTPGPHRSRHRNALFSLPFPIPLGSPGHRPAGSTRTIAPRRTRSRDTAGQLPPDCPGFAPGTVRAGGCPMGW